MNTVPSYLSSTVMIAIAFVAWQALARFSGAPTAWIGPLVLLGSLVGGGLLGLNGMATGPDIVWKSVLIVFCLGLVNGVAVHFNVINLTNPEIPTGTYLLVLTIMMAVLGPLIDALFAWTLPSPWKLAALGTGALTIYLAGK